MISNVTKTVTHKKIDDSLDHHSMSWTHSHDHITQQIHDLSDTTQQHSLHSMEENASLFTNDSTTPCDFNIIEKT